MHRRRYLAPFAPLVALALLATACNDEAPPIGADAPTPSATPKTTTTAEPEASPEPEASAKADAKPEDSAEPETADSTPPTEDKTGAAAPPTTKVAETKPTAEPKAEEPPKTEEPPKEKKPTGPVVGKPWQVVASVAADAGYKCNDMYPHKFITAGGSNVTYPNPKPKGGCAGKRGIAVSVPFVPTAAGAGKVSGTLKYGICDDAKTNCRVVKKSMSLPFTAKAE